MANLRGVARDAYEERIQKFMAKYGQQAQEVIKDLTTTTTTTTTRDTFEPTTTSSRYSHYGPTPTATSAVWDSAAPSILYQTQGWIAWFWEWHRKRWLGEMAWYTCCGLGVIMFWALILWALLRYIPKQQWDRAIQSVRWFFNQLSRPFNALAHGITWGFFRALGCVYDKPWVHEYRARRVKIWEKFRTLVWSLLSAATIFWLAYQLHFQQSCWVKVHELQHQGFHLPGWVYEASRHQHGLSIDGPGINGQIFEVPFTTTFHPTATEYRTATSTVTARQTFTKTIEVGGETTTGECQKTVHQVRWNAEPQTLTIHETLTLDSAPAIETVTIHERAEQFNAAPEISTVTNYLTGQGIEHDTITVTETATRYQRDGSQCRLTSTQQEIIANVTPTTVNLVRTKTSYKTRTITTTTPGGTLVRTSRIPLTLTITDTSVVAKTAKKVSTSMVYKASTTVAGGTIVRTTRLSHTTTVTETETSVVPGPTCALEHEEDHEEEAHVCEHVGKSIVYCKKCQQYHCCELRS
ncbi:hypothetical protein CLAFUW4_00844 [Fulvia fulva]|uniref:Uncharacterized protein n=1 Tax=Passalora fulva TaxID=5499 RepID=A0A9Q8L4W4_PASFU|nr:uncharacterized protein CLAFUR5_00847 [Fulvia fulva]KAK4634362.1 hypothetical protein CLAFUR4_00845 [Fulvia fulva]KAK4636766.1 hypothetical protein CLAFUR0_00845 [Fulvia fulva]UJO10827.1 hypothetical protein CLAFUR5_00847 [Fulvia fulva]WPV10124.1 hypothetical protein CLAFUW4_00844 [Fulvia fulva]WPV24176.1 hypothetical protein CLAFUW7_00972 [Fulvia fulva]